MSEKLKLKDVEKHLIEQVLEESSNGTVLKFVTGIKDSRVVYHVVERGSNVIELFDDLEKAIKRYNQLVD